jgi:hypothetical protein
MDLASLFSSVVQSAYGVESKIADLENRTESGGQEAVRFHWVHYVAKVPCNSKYFV